MQAKQEHAGKSCRGATHARHVEMINQEEENNMETMESMLLVVEMADGAAWWWPPLRKEFLPSCLERVGASAGPVRDWGL